MSLLEALKDKKKDMESKRQRDFSVGPPQGNSRWRILPHPSGDLEQLPVHDFGQHFIKDPVTQEVKAVVVCASKTYGLACEVCSQIDSLVAENLARGDEVSAEFYKEARATQKHLVNASQWTKNTDGNPGGTYSDVVQQLALPMTAFEQLMQIIETYLSEGITLFDLNTGLDIIVSRVGTGRNTKYTVQAAPTSTVAPAALLAKSVDLVSYVNQITEEKKSKAMAALGGSRPAALPPALPAPVLPASVTRAAPAPVVAPAPVAPETAIDVGGVAPAADSLDGVDLETLDLSDLDDVT